MSTPKNSDVWVHPENIKRTIDELNRERTARRWLRDLDLFRDVIRSADSIHQPINNFFAEKRDSDFSVATVSSSMRDNDLAPDESHKGYFLWAVKDARTCERLRQEFMEDVQIATRNGATFVCFNELAYPTPSIDPVGDDDFQKSISEILSSSGRDVFLVGGSYHDLGKCYNISPIFCTKALPDIERGRQQYYKHAKLTSAVRAREFIKVPPNRQLRCYETEFGSFNILICLDVYDPSLIFKLMRENHRSRTGLRFELIFVPSFSISHAPMLARASRNLSYATGALVFFVNCDANRPRHAAFLSGECLYFDGVPCDIDKRLKGRVESKELSERVVLHTIPHPTFYEYRVRRRDRYSSLFNYLIGERGVKYPIEF